MSVAETVERFASIPSIEGATILGISEDKERGGRLVDVCVQYSVKQYGKSPAVPRKDKYECVYRIRQASVGTTDVVSRVSPGTTFLVPDSQRVRHVSPSRTWRVVGSERTIGEQKVLILEVNFWPVRDGRL